MREISRGMRKIFGSRHCNKGQHLKCVSKCVRVCVCLCVCVRVLVYTCVCVCARARTHTWAHEGKGPERWFKEYMKVSCEYTDRCSTPLKLSLKGKSKPQYILHTWQNNHYQKDQRKTLATLWERGTHVLFVGVQVCYHLTQQSKILEKSPGNEISMSEK